MNLTKYLTETNNLKTIRLTIMYLSNLVTVPSNKFRKKEKWKRL